MNSELCTHLAMLCLLNCTYSPFCSVIYKIGSHFFPELAWIIILLISVSWVAWDDKHIAPHLAVGWNGVSTTFCPDWPWTTTLPISASQVARITGMSALSENHSYKNINNKELDKAQSKSPVIKKSSKSTHSSTPSSRKATGTLLKHNTYWKTQLWKA
jgi:hypothetical protein